MDKSVEVLKREALAAVLSAARDMLRQAVAPAAREMLRQAWAAAETGRVENVAALEAAYLELSGAMERWDEALEEAPAASMQSVLDAFTCRCEVPMPGDLDVCRTCGSFVPNVPAQEAA